MRVLIAAIAGLFATTLHAQGICQRPSSEPVGLCVGASASIRDLASCGLTIELYNREVDAWQKCQLDALEQDYRERRLAVLERASVMRNAPTEALSLRARMR